MKQVTTDLRDAITRLTNTRDFALFVQWLESSREELRASAEMPMQANRDFMCGGASVLSDVLKAAERK